ncbi:hypothetical protein [Zooshikella ganghwensis]|uniref:Uncharacterized protein n=1 Tax=Zooshikella ganghwensis TaxID=202772 RepID=A0A4V1IMT7_9GAMM|nr:hypothetical protein [Zooshikella ganghwensis]RDH41342.1 hypothetical protein B9G39_29165 [Zooshikella ganghwensis]RDH41371.1 hypothetical protein B9G39_29310 [Zooshikella ganghwensis]
MSNDISASRKYILLPASPTLLKSLQEVTDPDLIESCRRAWEKFTSNEIRTWLGIESKIAELVQKFIYKVEAGDDLYNYFYNFTQSGEFFVNLDNLEIEKSPEFLVNDFQKKVVFQWSSQKICDFLEIKESLVRKHKFIPEKVLLNIHQSPMFRFTDFGKTATPSSITYVIRELWNSHVNKDLYKGCNFFELSIAALTPLIKSKNIFIYDKNILKNLRGKQLLLSQIIYNNLYEGKTPEWPVKGWYDLFHLGDSEVKWAHFKRNNLTRYLPRISDEFAIDLKVIEHKENRNVVSAYIQIDEKESVDKPYRLVELESHSKQDEQQISRKESSQYYNQTAKSVGQFEAEYDTYQAQGNYKSQEKLNEKVSFSENLLSPTIRSNLVKKYSEHFLDYKLPQFTEVNSGKKHSRDMWIRRLKAYLQKGWNWWTTVNEDEWTSDKLKEAVFEKLAQNPHYDEEYDRNLADCLIDDYVRSRGLTTEVSRVLSYVCGSLEVFRAKKVNQLKLNQAYADNTDKHVDELKLKNRSTAEELNDFGWAGKFKFESGTEDA